jgi:hypothetical protein
MKPIVIFLLLLLPQALLAADLLAERHIAVSNQGFLEADREIVGSDIDGQTL